MSEIAIYKGPYLGDEKYYVRLDAYTALKAERDALAADRERFAVQCAAARIAVQYAQSQGFECTLNTPAVDAYANQLRAEGADAVAEYHRDRADALLDVDRRGANEHKVSYMAARDVAANLRKENGHD